MAKKTILRKANTQEIANVNEEYINMAEWTGLNDSTNYTSVDQSSFTEADNVYVDDENELRNRPPIVSTQPFETIECNDLEDNKYHRGIDYVVDPTGSSKCEQFNSHGSATVTYVEPETLYGTWYDEFGTIGLGTYDENDNLISVLINNYEFIYVENGGCTLIYTAKCFGKQAPQYIRNNKDGVDTYYYVTKIVIQETPDGGVIDPAISSGIRTGVFNHCTYVTELDINSYISDFNDDNLVFRGIGIDSTGVTVNFNYDKQDDDTQIPAYCFYSLYDTYTSPNLVTVNINSNISKIGTYAFAYSPIKTINVANAMMDIAHHAFYQCNNLTYAPTLSADTTLGNYCFAYCTSLLLNNLNINIVPTGCYYGCTALTTFYCGTNTATIETQAFYGCTNLTDMDCKHVETIGREAFAYCSSLNTIACDSVTSLGMYAFVDCFKLETLDLPKIITLNDYCFANSALVKVNIGNTLETVGTYIFNRVTSLEELTIPFVGPTSNTTTYSENTLFGYLFSSSSGNGLTACSQELYGDSYTMYIPASLSKVKITKGLSMTTGGVTMQALSDYTFSNCTMLTEIDIGDDSSSEANNIGRVQYAACTGCTNLKTVKLAHYVIAISGQVFTDCTALTTIYLPLSITIIADGATRSCSALTTVYYEGSSSDKSNISFNTGNDNIRYNATWTYNYEYEV